MSASKEFPPLTTSDTRSSISAIPMHEVEPSPVDEEEPPEYPTNPSDVEKQSLPSSAYNTTNFLGLTPSTTLRVLSSLQKYATIPPTIYLTMHYANTSLIPLLTQSARESDKYLLLTRPYYQSFPLEPLLIFAPIITHVASGIALRIYRRRLSAQRHGAETHTQRKKIPWPKPSLTSALGYAMYPLFVLHVLTQRMIPKKIEGSSAGVGLRYFAHGVAHDPWFTNIGYSVFVSIAGFHFVTGAAKFLKLSKEYIIEGGQSGQLKRKWRGRIINGIAAITAAVWIAGALGVVGRSGKGVGWEASNWDKIYKAVPLVGTTF
jgi:succinate dehydrogenase/fumarate reductase cytochrome b subunit